MNISVCVTSYNQSRYLKEAVESVLAQTFKPRQIIIVDDGSSDGSQNLIARFQSSHPNWIVAIHHTQNAGIAQARTDALRAVSGDHVTFLDGDDRFLPAKLEKEARLLSLTPDAQLAFSNVYYINEQGMRTGVWAEGVKPPQGDIFCQTFARDFPKGNLFRSELVNYNAWRQVGFYDPNLRDLYEDFDMRIRLTGRLSGVYCDEPLSEYRRHSAGLSQVELSRHVKALDYIYRKNKPFLRELSPSEREHADRRLKNVIARIAQRASQQALCRNRRFEALRLFFVARRFDRSVTHQLSLARILMPRSFYGRMTSAQSGKRSNH